MLSIMMLQDSIDWKRLNKGEKCRVCNKPSDPQSMLLCDKYDVLLRNLVSHAADAIVVSICTASNLAWHVYLKVIGSVLHAGLVVLINNHLH